ncbi:hypothetical protein P7K49_000663 [Saguinus oedipus]|uniref:Uncharacterized protein n=1 Tax=Saguinus oedipus TaxID=9490 RepID=A0ABQ9WCE2_SAGOE|nr:hypothetical protein P7K49_000663 [Saguinus oedipus]
MEDLLEAGTSEPFFGSLSCDAGGLLEPASGPDCSLWPCNPDRSDAGWCEQHRVWLAQLRGDPGT